MIEQTLKDIASSIDDVYGAMNPNNDFGQSVGDELHTIAWQLERIADVLEKIESNMK